MTDRSESGSRAAPRLSLRWWSAELGLSRRKLGKDIAAQKLRAIRVGGRTLVLEKDMDVYLATHATMAARTDPSSSEYMETLPRSV